VLAHERWQWCNRNISSCRNNGERGWADRHAKQR